uniref:Helicase ATP-binding domain-containing protein n=1 Tax=Ditylenchus dipsaci TaxID=166011 RepID=A0A915CV43_9BILA
MVKQEPACKPLIEFDTYAPHLRLFQQEALKHIRWEDIKRLLKFTNRSQHEKLSVLFAQEGLDVRKKANELLFKCVSYAGSADANAALKELISRERNEEVQMQLKMAGLRTYEYALKLYRGQQMYIMDRMVNMLEPEPIIKYLEGRNCREYDHLIVLVKGHMQKGSIEDAACELMRGLPYCSDVIGSDRKNGEWYYDFLEACLTHPDTRMLPEFLDKDYKEDLLDFRANREVELRAKCNAELYTTGLSDKIHERAYSHLRQTTQDFSDIKKEYVLYTYQSELVSHARNGRNTIICAPTGSGKTIVATDIMLHHLENMKREGKEARVVMLVPTVPLVDQQTVQLVSYMINKHWVDGISGVEPTVDRQGRILASDVVVMTPQIFINMLNSVVKQEKLYFQDFTMMIFDECHHAGNGENHPYKILLEMLQEQAAGWKPQIIGLTASVGVGKASFQINVARKHILELCSIMMADSISTVRKYLDDLKEKVPPPVDEMERARRPLNDDFINLIKDTMRDLQLNMAQIMERVLEKQPDALKREDFDFLRDFKMIEKGPQYQAKSWDIEKVMSAY